MRTVSRRERAGTPARPAFLKPLGWLVPAIWTGGLFPAALLIWDGVNGSLGANPIQRATLQAGLLTLVLLILSLTCTPLRLLTRWTWPARIRRPLGLLAFGYGVLHFLIYLLDHSFDTQLMLEDVLKRPFVTAGFTALLILVPLALTSTPGAVKRLGFARWTRLHQLVYVAVSLGVLHYYWGVKKDHTLPLIYAGVVAGLLLVRGVYGRWGGRASASRGPTPRPPTPGGQGE